MLRVVHACIDKLTAKQASLIAETEQAKAKRDTLAALIRGLEVTVSTYDGELDVVVRTMQSLKSRVAAGKDWANTKNARACEMWYKMPELRSLVERLNQTVRGQRAHDARVSMQSW